MSLKAVSSDGLLYFFQKLKEIFVRQESGKGLSSNDFTTEEKNKLYGIDTGANKTTIVDNLTSTSTTDALSSNQGKVLDEKIKAITDNLGDFVGGDFAPISHKHPQSDINGLDTVVGSITAIASGKCKSEVFDTVADLDEWLKNETNTATLQVGDVFLIKAIDVPDYWWDGSAKQQLETTKVEIDYITNAEIDTIVAS
jgi:hypothetical protein